MLGCGRRRLQGAEQHLLCTELHAFPWFQWSGRRIFRPTMIEIRSPKS